METGNKNLLEVGELCLGFGQGKHFSSVLTEVSFRMEEGEILGLVGESGSGKTMTALAVMGLLPEGAQITKGSISFLGQPLLSLDGAKRRKLKGEQMAMIFQDPLSSLNPVLTVGKQVEELLVLHTSMGKKERYAKTVEALSEAGLKEAEELYHKYPYQLSGGMRQRVMIAMAMICRPRLLLADEPTTALDVTIQAQILEQIKKLNRDLNISVLFISHDLGVIKNVCGRALVMKDGFLAEEGTVHELFYHPQREYTKRLLDAVPKKNTNERLQKEKEKRLSELAGAEEILSAEHVNAYYNEHAPGLFKGKGRRQVLRDINFSMRRGEILGIVGESGSGKSTLAKAVTGLLKDREGSIILSEPSPRMVFQDPYASLNPSKKVEWLLEEPLKMKGQLSKAERKAAVREMLHEVGLKDKHLERYVSELSGGQRQRVSIACAMILKPGLVILDEPVSSLDVTVQAQILRLLLTLREKFDVSYLFISHDLNVVYRMCDRVGVMYRGKLVELADSFTLYEHPQHEYTKKLLAAIPDF